MYNYRISVGVLVALCGLLSADFVKGDAGASAYSSSYAVDPQQQPQQQQQQYNTPGTAYSAPSSSYQAQSSSGGYPAPASGYGGGYPAPMPAAGYGTPAPAPPSGYASGGYAAAAPSPAPSYGAPDSGYAAPSPDPSYGPPDSGYGAPAQGYGTPAPPQEYGPPAPAGGYGPSPTPAPTKIVRRKKFKFLAVAAAIKFMMLWLLYVLYKIVYFGTVPQSASASKPVCKNKQKEEDTRAIVNVTERFINQLIAGMGQIPWKLIDAKGWNICF